MYWSCYNDFKKSHYTTFIFTCTRHQTLHICLPNLHLTLRLPPVCLSVSLLSIWSQDFHLSVSLSPSSPSDHKISTCLSLCVPPLHLTTRLLPVCLSVSLLSIWPRGFYLSVSLSACLCVLFRGRQTDSALIYFVFNFLCWAVVFTSPIIGSWKGIKDGISTLGALSPCNFLLCFKAYFCVFRSGKQQECLVLMQCGAGRSLGDCEVWKVRTFCCCSVREKDLKLGAPDMLWCLWSQTLNDLHFHPILTLTFTSDATLVPSGFSPQYTL